ncbi:hypothetical protein X742_20810 [Mesorhizobium sp. LNHC232B00]|nr:hypothetical protein X742_20810 [Mesorhizobium sp. LNHC232B00]
MMSQFKAQELCQLKELFRFTNRLVVSDFFGLLRHTFVGLTTVDTQIGSRGYQPWARKV